MQTQIHPLFRPRNVYQSHQGCVICTQYGVSRLSKHQANLAKLRLVAASLRVPKRSTGQAAPEKQETPGSGSPEVSTRRSNAVEARAASAQFDTNRRR